VGDHVGYRHRQPAGRGRRDRQGPGDSFDRWNQPDSQLEATVSCLTPDGVVNVSTGVSMPVFLEAIRTSPPRWTCRGRAKTRSSSSGSSRRAGGSLCRTPTLSPSLHPLCNEPGIVPGSFFLRPDRSIGADFFVLCWGDGVVQPLLLWPRSPGGVPSTTFAAPAASVADRTPLTGVR